jgi:hypothetical protein
MNSTVRQELQQVECKLFCQAVMDAGRLLGVGEYAAGYRCLLVGMEHVRELAASGEPWAEDLVCAYRGALFDYAFLYPTPRGLVADD